MAKELKCKIWKSLSKFPETQEKPVKAIVFFDYEKDLKKSKNFVVFHNKL